LLVQKLLNRVLKPLRHTIKSIPRLVKVNVVAKEVWKTPDPTKKNKPLSKKKKASAKARAKAAGRPYPNLVDNMAAARKKK
jgi:hypothetical protein